MRQALRQRAAQRQQTSNVMSYPSPVAGWNARDALAAMKPIEAIALENWFPGTSYCEIRGGSASHFTGTSGNGKTLMVYNSQSGANKMFVATNIGIYDATSAAAATANYLNLPGASGDYASTPDSAALDITGDIEFIVYAAADDWTAAGTQAFASKWQTGGQLSYRFAVTAAGALVLLTSNDGTTQVGNTSTSALSTANGTGVWVRVTLDVNDGAGNRVANFYTSTDSSDTAVGSISWTQLGATVTTAGATTIFSSTSVLEIGSSAAGTLTIFDGKIYAAHIYNGIGGTLVAAFDASDAVAGAATVVSADTGETYTVNGSAAIVGSLVLPRTNGKHQWEMFGDGTNNWLIACNGVDKPAYYDGTTWTAVDATTTPALTGVTSTELIDVHGFKGRLFFIQKSSMSFWYLAAGAAGGALTEFDLSAETTRGGYLVGMETWTRDAGDGQDDVAIFLTSEGDAIVYQGNNPGSAAAWVKIGVYFVGRPLGRRSMTQYGGDLVVLTENGTFPMSAAMQSAIIDYKLALSFKIEPVFTAAARSYFSTFGWKTQFFPNRNAMLVNVPISEGGEHEQYVMNTITKAWCRFKEWDAEDFAVFNGELYFCTGTSVYKAWTGTEDVGGNAIIAYGKTAFSNFKMPGVQKQFKMFRPVLAVNGNLTFLTDIDIDFQDTLIAGTATYSVTSGARWDVSDWDVGTWAQGLEVVKAWTSPDEWTGYWGAGKVKIETNALTIQWASCDYVFQTGGVL